MAEKIIIFEADIKIDEAVAETARLKEEVTKLTFETEKLKRSQGETSEAYIKSKATLDNASTSLKKNESIVKTLVAQNNQNTEAVGKFDDVTKSATKRLREINVELSNMAARGEQNTQKFKDLQKEGGHLRDSIDEVRARIKLYASDTRQLDQAIAVFQGIGAAAQIAEGANALLGKENEELAKSIQRMVAIQSVLNGLQEIQNLLQKESGVMILANSIKLKAMAAAQAIYTTAVGASTGAMKVFRTALLATGIGAIIAGIAALVLNWDKLTASISKSSIEAERYAKEMDKVRSINEANSEFDNFALQLMKERGAVESEIIKKEIEINKNRQAAIEQELVLLEEISARRLKSEEETKRFNDLLDEQTQKKDEAIFLSIRLEKQLGEEEAKRIEASIKANNERIKSENDVKEALLKTELAFFDEVDKIRAEIVKRDLDRIESYNNDIFAEYEDQLNREAEIEGEKSQRLVERLNTDFENEMAILEMNEATKFEARKMWLEAQKAEELRVAEDIGANTELINEKYRALDLELERAKVDAKLALSASFMGNIATLFGEGTAIGKAAAITETIINTYKGAQAAYASLSSIPVVGPALGAVAAAAQIKVGFNNIKKIKAAGKGGGGGATGATTASAPIANAVNPSVSMGAVSGAVGTSTGQMVTNAVDSSAKTQIAVVVDDVTAKQNQQTNANKLATL